MIKRKGLPNQNELVMCTVKKITPYAAWCDVDEYDCEGMIHVSEAAGKWVHDIREFVKQGKQYVAKVVKVDTDKNIVNLSLKRVSRRDEKEKLNAFRKEERAEKILEQAAASMNKTLAQAYDEVGYLLQEKFGELSTAFEEGKRNRAELEGAGVPRKWVNEMMPLIEKAYRDKEVVLRADITLKSYEGDGVDRVKSFLSEMKKGGLDVSYISAPKYIAEFRTKSPKNDEKMIRDVLDRLAQKSKDMRVEFEYKIVKQ